MGKKILFEDIELGTIIPELIKHPSKRQLVMWAGASEDFMEVHYDKDAAMSVNLPGVIVHGALKSAFLGQMLTDWFEEAGTLKEFECRYQGIDFPGEDIICRGKVVKKYVDADEKLIDCEIWTENPRGERTTTGTAIIALP